MPDKSPADVVRSFWETFATRRLDALVHDHIADDCEFVMPGMPPLRGPTAIQQMFEGYTQAIPDFACTTLHAIESGDTYAAETRFSGTRGGQPVTWQSADIVRVVAGKIVSWHIYNDREIPRS